MMTLRERMQPSVKARKVFHHMLLPKTELDAEIIEGFGRYYTTPSGLKYPSVTTALGLLSKAAIEDWKDRVGVDEARKILNQACHRGTLVHNIAEKYVLNDPNWAKDEFPFDLHTFSKIAPILDKRVDYIMGIEYPLWSDRLRTAGRTDLIAMWDGSPAIIDFKTSRKVKHKENIQNYFMQATAYAAMLKERLNIVCKDIVILMMVDHEDPIIFHDKTKNWITTTTDFFKAYRDPMIN